MLTSRRSFFRAAALAVPAIETQFSAGQLATTVFRSAEQERRPDPFADLKPMTSGVKPLAAEDYEARIEKARRLMRERKIDLFFIGGGTSLEYFGGFRWGLSERVFAMLLPARGDLAYLVPKFEEGRAREQIRFGSEVRTWEEDESPYLKFHAFLQERKAAAGTVAIEPATREFISDGLRRACPAVKFVNGEEITQGCRMIKTAKELEFMRVACEVTKRAYEAALRTVRGGMSQQELSRAISAAHSRLGAPGGAFVTFGPNSAFPHGSKVDRPLAAGDVILMDGGCKVEGFESDITRTVVFGKPSDKVRKVWDVVKKAQGAALAAARPGASCESVDAAARKVITDAGFGPGYAFFTHRVGHGIGMEGHEYPYLVRGNKLALERGMTFSDEPGIYIVGEFGVRLEDLIWIGDDRAHYFGAPAAALET